MHLHEVHAEDQRGNKGDRRESASFPVEAYCVFPASVRDRLA